MQAAGEGDLVNRIHIHPARAGAQEECVDFIGTLIWAVLKTYKLRDSTDYI